MKKSYSKAEAFKVSFNANEQVAADACALSADTAKYDYDFTGCTDEGSQYATTSTSYTICFVGTDGVMDPTYTGGETVDYDDYASQYAS